ncbi:hypothetical protein GGR42_000256 [Saonia flava]|uniref:Outer membrane protein beta-barrel domain-containing protein n=1 Tax=Saonia flava TaxID=523696 RepID=A0A846QXG3_9FLAO|nr:hypothetical protein [Saonia flava]NJB69794.1 hypothetical protein [Saonia flava]
MKRLLFLFALAGCLQSMNSQDTDAYFEFNDRKTVVHGVYVGVNFFYGKIDNANTYSFESHVAYVVDRKLILGLGWTSFYSEQNFTQFTFSDDIDFAGGYGGFHIEPILFSEKKVNLSLPVLIGLGYVGYLDKVFDRDGTNELLINNNNDLVFVVEPGINVLYNISRYVQLEAGIRYRISDKIDLEPHYIKNINGFSAGLGIRLGVFNLGRNRYKKNIETE